MLNAGGVWIENIHSRKYQYMPPKKIFLARAGAVYSKILNDETLMEVANRIYLRGLDIARPVVYWEVSKNTSFQKTQCRGFTKLTKLFSSAFPRLVRKSTKRSKDFRIFHT